MNQVWMLYPKGRLLKEELYQIYATEARNLGAEVIFFSNESVDWETKTINGFVYDGVKWRKKQTPMPNNMIALDDYENTLGGSLITPTPLEGCLLLDQWAIYETLQQGEYYFELIPSEKIKSSGHFFRILKEYRRLVMKPTIGLKEYVIEQKGNRYFVKGCEKTIEKSQGELRQFIIELQEQEQHIVQPHLLCRTNEGEVFDLEVSLQKNDRNQWRINKIVPRFYLRNQSYVDNEDIDSFLMANFPYNSSMTSHEIQIFCNQFLQRLEKKYNVVREISLFLKIDDLQKIWVDEIQWKVNEAELVRKHLKKVLLFSEKRGD